MKKGVVIHQKDGCVTLLTPDGQFMTAKSLRKNCSVGEEITFLPSEADRKDRAGIFFGERKIHFVRYGAISAIALIVLVFACLPFMNNEKVYAYMTVDINPSFELAMNSKMQVIKIEPINADGSKLIKEMPDIKHETLKNAVNTIVFKSKEMGYIKQGKHLLIATVLNSEDEEYGKSLLKRVNSLKGAYKKEDLPVKIVQTDLKTREKAKEEGISTGKYLELHLQPPSGKSKGAASDGSAKKTASPPKKIEQVSVKAPAPVETSRPADRKEFHAAIASTKSKLQQTKRRLQKEHIQKPSDSAKQKHDFKEKKGHPEPNKRKENPAFPHQKKVPGQKNGHDDSFRGKENLAKHRSEHKQNAAHKNENTKKHVLHYERKNEEKQKKKSEKTHFKQK
ncbi:anti-sigma factor domain-containing protein [Metabacillus sp. GX 13764]|uniref:anti-sigma factor domain-containing protein n=1 Tax=Metabacillus kandeliae TaxID=2900151 RepID=UPI001E3C3DF2|nr:anti-sigma factor domain-containing protein [Metabacillus kandeliae]MCD7036184.1 anti-sigma factor domain-containing protein [Metabacillus kandeliae]